MSSGTVPLDVPSGLPARLSTPELGDPRLARLSLNQRTIAGASLAEAVDVCVRAGIDSIGVWREPAAEVGLAVAGKMLADAGLRVSSLCRGGFFNIADRAAAHADNLAALDEAAELGTGVLVLVPGGLPAGERDLPSARARVAEGIAALVEPARARGVRLGIEPMHPIFAADRGVISTLRQALDIAEQHPADVVGVVVDSFHLWWEPAIANHIANAGERIVSYQIADWITPLPADSLLSRGMVGDGHIDFAEFTGAVADAGYSGDVEVEIFNADIWAARSDDVVSTVVRRFAELIAPHLVDPRRGATATPGCKGRAER